MATRYWVAWIKERLGVKTAYQIKKCLLEDSVLAEKNPGWLNHSSRFWNRKENGQPASQEKLVNQVESCSKTKGAKGILCHCFWELIDQQQIDQDFLNHILLQLPSMYRGKLFSDDNSAVRRQTLRARTAEKLEVPYTLDSLTCFLALAIEEGWAEQKNSCRRAHGCQMTVIKLFLRQSLLTPLSAVSEDLYTTISEQLQHLFTTSVYDPFYFEFNDHNDHQRQLIHGFFAHCELIFSGSLKLYGEWLTQARKAGLTKNAADDKAFLWSVFLTEAEKLESVLFDDDPKRTNSHPLILKLKSRMDDFKKYTGP